MGRSKHLVPLSHDHHHGLVLARLLKKNASAYRNLPSSPEGKKEYALSFYQNELAGHFYKEENILFPAVQGKEGDVDTLLNEVITEHRKIEKLISSLSEDINPEDRLDELGKLLELHIRKEERDLFNKIETLLNEDELSALNKELKKNEI